MFHRKKYKTDNLRYMTGNPNKLGEWIRGGLDELGQTQIWLAERIGVQAPQVSRIISGKSEAPPDVLSAIADALGKPRIQAYRAAGYLEKLPRSDEIAEVIIHEMSDLTPQEKDELLMFIKMKKNLRKRNK